MTYEVLTDELIDKIADSPSPGAYLVLGPHPEFQGQWIVQSLESDFEFEFEDIIGGYRAVSVGTLPGFLTRAKELEYTVVFEDSPVEIIDSHAKWNEPPCVSLNSSMEGTVNGMLPWQVEGFNKLKDISGKAIWDTGAGKTALMAALIKYHQKSFDLCFCMSKAHNKINTQRKLKQLGDIESVVLEAYSLEKRADMYADLFDRLEAGERLVVITNYEKFRDDEEAIKLLCQDRDLLIFWDEMPTRLSNRETKLYEAVLRTIWRTKEDKPKSVPNPLKAKLRVNSYRGYELTATPIENDIEGDFNCTRLVDPTVFGSVVNFRNEYVASYSFFDRNKPDTFHRLDKFTRVQEHIVHRVSKKDPEVAKYFPKVRYEPIYIDWDPKDRKNYDVLTGKVREVIEGDFEEANILALMGVMQMMCDMPSMINVSADRRLTFEKLWEEMNEAGIYLPPSGSAIALELLEGLGKLLDNKTHTKPIALRELLTVKHADEKVLVFTSFGPMLIPILSDMLTDWGVNHVTYTGTQKQRQTAQDHFRSNDSCRVFLSSDAGSDSIDLEQASVGIDYDLPFKYTTRIQRWNRANRPNSVHELNTFYSLIMVDSVEERRLEIIEKKKGYHDAVYNNIDPTEVIGSRMTKEDLLYVLGVSEN